MATVSGVLYYDGNRTATVSTATGIIEGVTIILQDVSPGPSPTRGMMTACLTDSNGAFQFTNVPNGSYQVVEDYKTYCWQVGTADWSQADTDDIRAGGSVPPLNTAYVKLYTPSADPLPGNALDCTVRNTWLYPNLTGSVTNIYMMNAPVMYTGLTLAPNVVVDPVNLVTGADGGTYGFFDAGTNANTGVAVVPPDAHPYPEIESDFIYAMPQVPPPTSVVPNDGQYTVQNIMNNAWSNSHPSTTAPSWWRVADKTTGNETGRLMIVNGYTAGYIIRQGTETVEANKNYLVSYWVLNMCRQPTGYINPEFSVVVLDGQDNEIYRHNFTDEIKVNPLYPEWINIGTIFNTGDNTQVTIKFISEGGAETGNDFALDDIALNKVDILELDIIKDVCSYATIGGTLYYRIIIQNNTDYLATQITLTDDLSANLEYIYFTLDGETWIPWTGTLAIDDLDPGESGEILIKGKVKEGAISPIVNAAYAQASFCPIDEEN